MCLAMTTLPKGLVAPTLTASMYGAVCSSCVPASELYAGVCCVSGWHRCKGCPPPPAWDPDATFCGWRKCQEELWRAARSPECCKPISRVVEVAEGGRALGDSKTVLCPRSWKIASSSAATEARGRTALLPSRGRTPSE